MIDLRKKALPDSITIEGRAFLLNTDFRVWLDFGEKIKNKGCTLRDLIFVFKDDFPDCNFLPELLDFYRNDNATPNKDMLPHSSDTLVDYILDGEYIYASFMYDYGIDLIDSEYMHWHKFKALFTSLSEDSKMKTIMSIRGYEKTPKNYDFDKEREKLKRIWSLDELLTEEELAALEEFNNL